MTVYNKIACIWVFRNIISRNKECYVPLFVVSNILVLGALFFTFVYGVFFMITVRGIITLLVLAVLFALAVVWISRQGGWKGEGCGGNCASCHQHCDTPEKKH